MTKLTATPSEHYYVISAEFLIFTLSSESSRSTDSVNILFLAGWEVVVDDQGDLSERISYRAEMRMLPAEYRYLWQEDRS